MKDCNNEHHLQMQNDDMNSQYSSYALVKTSCVKINLKKIPHMRFVYITVYCQGRAAITIYTANRNHAFLLSLITCPDYAYSKQHRFQHQFQSSHCVLISEDNPHQQRSAGLSSIPGVPQPLSESTVFLMPDY